MIVKKIQYFTTWDNTEFLLEQKKKEEERPPKPIYDYAINVKKPFSKDVKQQHLKDINNTLNKLLIRNLLETYVHLGLQLRATTRTFIIFSAGSHKKQILIDLYKTLAFLRRSIQLLTFFLARNQRLLVLDETEDWHYGLFGTKSEFEVLNAIGYINWEENWKCGQLYKHREKNRVSKKRRRRRLNERWLRGWRRYNTFYPGVTTYKDNHCFEVWCLLLVKIVVAFEVSAYKRTRLKGELGKYGIILLNFINSNENPLLYTYVIPTNLNTESKKLYFSIILALLKKFTLHQKVKFYEDVKDELSHFLNYEELLNFLGDLQKTRL